MKTWISRLFTGKTAVYVLVLSSLLRGFIYHFFQGVNSVLNICCILLGIIALVSWLRKGNKTSTDYLSLALLFIIILSVIVNRIPVDSSHIVSFATVSILLFLVFTEAEGKDHKMFLKEYDQLAVLVVGFVFLLAMASAIAYVTWRAHIVLPYGLNSEERILTYGHLGYDSRFCGYFGYSTDGGNLCSLAAVLTIYLIERKKLPYWTGIMAFLLFSANIVFLDVRTSMLEILLIIAVILWKSLQRYMKASHVILLLSALLICGVIVFFIKKAPAVDAFKDAFAADPKQALEDLSTGRTSYWLNAIDGFRQKTLLGWGWLDNSQIDDRFFDVHNLFFNMLLWTGAAGTIVLAVLLWRIFHSAHLIKGILNQMHCSWMTVMLWCVLLESMLDRAILGSNNVGVETCFFWLTAGFMLALRKEQKQA